MSVSRAGGASGLHSPALTPISKQIKLEEPAREERSKEDQERKKEIKVGSVHDEGR